MANDYYKYVKETGLIVPDTGTVKSDVESEWQTTFGADLDLTPSTPQGRMIEMETLARVNTIGICALVANQINIDYATGQYLDAIGAFYGVQRAGATQTRTLATITGVPGTVIPANSQAMTDDGDLFYSENETTIPAGGSTTSYFLSVEYGPIPCATGTLNTIVDQTIGWETITNTVSAIIGSEQESDFNFRKRIKNARYTGISLVASIKGGLELVPNLLSSFVYDNGEKTSTTYQGITVDANSILVIADGGTNEEVAQTIFNKRSGGCGYTAIPGQSVTVSVQDGAYGVSYDVIFNRPQIINFDVNVQVRANKYTGTTEELIQEVKNAVLSWADGQDEIVDGLKIGQNVSPYEIGASISDQIPSIYVKSCLICLSGGTPAANELTCTVAQKYSVSEGNITVTVV